MQPDDKIYRDALHNLLHFYNLKNVKNSHGGVLLLEKLQAEAYNYTKSNTIFHGCFSRFLNCTNSTKSRKASYMSY